MIRNPVPNSWIAYDAASATRLSYAFQVAPSPLVTSVDGDDPTLASLQVVITNPTTAAITVNSVTFVVPVGTGRSLMQTTANVDTSVSDPTHWSFPPPATTVTTGTCDFTLDSAAGSGVVFDAGASVVVEIFQFATVLAPTTASITINERLDHSGTTNSGAISVTTFPAGFFFNGLTASVPAESGGSSGLTPVAQVPVNTAVKLTWNSSVVDTGKITILYSDAAAGQQTASPTSVGEWLSPALTADTVFTVSVEAAQIGGDPILASMSTAVSVQNPALVAAGLSVNGGAHVNGLGMPFLVTTNQGGGAMVGIQNNGTADAEASINYATGQLGWNVGVGGGASPGVFFFWNSAHQIVATIDLTGTMTLRGSLTVGGLVNAAAFVVQQKTPMGLMQPNVPNAQPGQMMWDETGIWIYNGTEWLVSRLEKIVDPPQ